MFTRSTSTCTSHTVPYIGMGSGATGLIIVSCIFTPNNNGQWPPRPQSARVADYRKQIEILDAIESTPIGRTYSLRAQINIQREVSD